MIPFLLLEQVKQRDFVIYRQGHPVLANPWYSGVVIEIRKKTNRGVTVRPTDKRIGERTQSIDMNGNIALVTERILLDQEEPDKVLSLIVQGNPLLSQGVINTIYRELNHLIRNYRSLT